MPLEDFDIPLERGEDVGEAGGDMVKTATIVSCTLSRRIGRVTQLKDLGDLQSQADRGVYMMCTVNYVACILFQCGAATPDECAFYSPRLGQESTSSQQYTVQQ